MQAAYYIQSSNTITNGMKAYIDSYKKMNTRQFQ